MDEAFAWAASQLESGSPYDDIIGGASRAQLEQLSSFGLSHMGEPLITPPPCRATPCSGVGWGCSQQLGWRWRRGCCAVALPVAVRH